MLPERDLLERAAPNPPSRHRLLAALRAGAVLDEAGTDPALLAGSYLRLPTEALFDADALTSGGNLLRALGLVVERDGLLFRDSRLTDLLMLGDDLASRMLLAIALDHHDPLWLQTAASGENGVASELIPDEAQQALESVVPDPEEREAMLIALANKFDASQRTATGDLGEQAVVRQCRRELKRLGRPDLAPAVRRVSLVSDQLGYDVVAPHLDGGMLRLEVKTTRSAPMRDVSFFLSRNEARVGVRDSRWRLVVCRVLEGDDVTVVGSSVGAFLSPLLPSDTPRGRWTSALLAVSVADLAPGLPPLENEPVVALNA